jgi:DNA-binding transcriptional regulator YiaG
MEFNIDIAKEIQAKYEFKDATIEKWKELNVIPNKLLDESYVICKGMNLRQARRFCAISQESLIERLLAIDFSCTRQSIINWELGRNMPSKNARKALNKVLGKAIKEMENNLVWDN